MGILERQGKFEDIEGLKMPKHGSLKVGEVQEYAELLKAWPELSKSLSAEQASIELTLQCLTILLQRIDPDWTIEKTRSKDWSLPIDGKDVTFEPDSILTEALYAFWQGERDRWPTPDESNTDDSEDDAPGKKPTGKKSTGDVAKRSPARKRSAAAKTS